MSKELGTLAVVVLKARNLHDRHSFYKQDPYAKVALNGKSFKTDADIKGGQHPEWDAEFRFPVFAVKNDSSRQLEVACWRAEPRDDEEIGKGKVDISGTLRTGEFDDWVTINDVTGTYKGEIYLEMTFFASGPPQLERRPSKLPPQERLQHLKKPSGAPSANGRLAAGAPHTPGYSPPKNDKPLPSIQESQGPAPLPSILRPGTGTGKVNGPGGRPDGVTSPVNSRPPSSLFASRPQTSPIQQPNNASPFRVPGQHSPGSPGNRHSSSYSPPRVGYSPPRTSYSPPRQPKIEHNPYISDPAPPSNPAPGYFPSPQIVLDSTPPGPAPSSHNPFTNQPGHSPPQPPAQTPHPISTYPGGPGFPSASPQSPPSFSPPQQTPSVYPPPQSPYPPPQSGYPQPPSNYPPPSQLGYPLQAPPQFPPHQSTYPSHHQSTYPMYGHTPPAPGPGQHQFFGRGREGSIGELSDPALMQRYSSPLPLPANGKPPRSSSPFAVPSVSPPHPAVSTYSPSAEYERELQRRREQEERDAELARRLDMEFNLGG